MTLFQGFFGVAVVTSVLMTLIAAMPTEYNGRRVNVEAGSKMAAGMSIMFGLLGVVLYVMGVL
jgi:hypothetical protein